MNQLASHKYWKRRARKLGKPYYWKVSLTAEDVLANQLTLDERHRLRKKMLLLKRRTMHILSNLTKRTVRYYTK